jgi:hypothetical protein
MKRKGELRIDDLDADDLEGAQQIVDLEVESVHAVERPAHSRGWIIRKAADLKHPTNDNNKHLDRSREPENPLLGLDPKSSKDWQRLLAEIRKIVQDELRAYSGKPNSLLTKSAPKASAPPRSTQPQAGDGDTIISKAAGAGRKPGQGLFTNIVFGQEAQR